MSLKKYAGDDRGRPGRPSKKSQPSLQQCDLYRFLLKRLPPEYIRSAGYLDIKKMSEVSGFSQFSIIRWMRGVHFTKNSISALVKISGETQFPDKKGLLTKEELVPFLIKD